MRTRTEAVLDDKAIAQSHSVAKAAMAKLGVHESVGAFAAAYSVSVVTERVLQFMVSAPSASEAVSRAAAIASSFLQFKAAQEETTQQVVIQSMESQLPADTAERGVLDAQISRVKRSPRRRRSRLSSRTSRPSRPRQPSRWRSSRRARPDQDGQPGAPRDKRQRGAGSGRGRVVLQDQAGAFTTRFTAWSAASR